MSTDDRIVLEPVNLPAANGWLVHASCAASRVPCSRRSKSASASRLRVTVQNPFRPATASVHRGWSQVDDALYTLMLVYLWRSACGCCNVQRMPKLQTVQYRGSEYYIVVSRPGMHHCLVLRICKVLLPLPCSLLCNFSPLCLLVDMGKTARA